MRSAPSLALWSARSAVKQKTGAQVGWVLSSEKLQSGCRRPRFSGRQNKFGRYRESQRDPA